MKISFPSSVPISLILQILLLSSFNLTSDHLAGKTSIRKFPYTSWEKVCFSIQKCIDLIPNCILFSEILVQ